MRSLRCWSLRASLVDFAEGRLDEQGRESIERHLAGCAHCAAAVLSLREIPAELRRLAAPDPGEEFWSRQRERVLGAIEDARAARLRRPRSLLSRSPWVPIAAVAASALAIVLGVELRPRSSAPLPHSNPTLSRTAANGSSTSTDVLETSSAGIFPEDLFEPSEASFETSSAEELEYLGSFLEDATI